MRKFLLLILLVASLGAQATQYTWNGGASGSWNTNSNWLPNTGFPSSNSDEAIFSTTNAIITLPTTSFSLGKLTINNSVTLQNSTSITITLGNTSLSSPQFFVAASNSLTLQSTANSVGTTISLVTGCKGSISGTVNLSAGTSTGQAHKLISPDVSGITFQNGSFCKTTSVSSSTPFNITTSGTNGSVVFASGSEFDFLGGTTPFGPSPLTISTFQPGSIYSHQSSSTNPTGLGETYGIFDFNSTGTLTLSASGSTCNIGTLKISKGTLSLITLSSGTANSTINIQNDITIAASATLNVGAFSGTNTNSAGVIVNFSGTSQSFTNLGTFNVNSYTSNSNATYKNQINVNSGSTLTLNSDFDMTSSTYGSAANRTLTIASGGTLSIATGKTLTIPGTITNNGTISGAGVVNLNGSSAQTIAGTGSVTNLTLNNTNGATISSTQTLSGTLTLTSGTLTNGASGLSLSSGATIARAAGALSAAPTFNTSVNLNYNSGAATTVGYEYPSVSTILNDLTIASSTTLSSLPSTITLKGNFSNSGTVSGTPSIVLNGSATQQTISGNTSFNNFTLSNSLGANISSGTQNVAGTFTNGASIIGVGIINLNGSSAQAISGTGSLTNLTLNNAAGATISSGTQTLSGTLTLTSGKLTNGASGLSLSSGATIARAAGSLGTAPTFNTSVNVTYNSGTATTIGVEYPSVATLLNSLTISSGTIVNSLPTALVLKGNFSNSGSITGTHSITFNGTSAQTLSGTNTFTDFTLTNAAGATITSGNQNITGTLLVSSGTLNTGGFLTLKSTSITNTAIVGKVDGKISGNVNIERYIPAGYRGYRDIAPEVYNASNTVYNTWQEGGRMLSDSGIFITGPTATHADDGFYGSTATATQPAPASSGLDYSINGTSSAYTYTSLAGFEAIKNTTTTSLDPLASYRVLIRGDRGFNLAKTPIVNVYGYGLLMVKATTLRASGKLIAGDVTYNNDGATATAADGTTSITSTSVKLNTTIGAKTGFSMVSNPYACPVFWGDPSNNANDGTNVFGVSKDINGSYWFLDPTHSATGTYGAYNALSGSVYSGNTTSAYIQPGQAFFVQTYAASPKVVFKETAKAASVAKVAVFGVSKPLSKIYISLLLQDSTSKYASVDAAAVAFATSFGNTTYGPQDALKFGTSNNSIAITDKGTSLSIDGRLPATATDILPIALNKMSGKNYKLVIDASAYDAAGLLPVLKDNYTGTEKTLSIGIDTINFTVDTSLAASYASRFSLAFKPTTLAVNSIIASATLNNKIATISWNTVGEKGVSKFEVEKSTDSKSFTKIAQAIAKNTASASYTTTDNSATATTYYRIKAISQVGTFSYSNVVKLLTFDSKLSTYSLYPNPLKGSKVVNVSMSNVAAGKYTVIITNVLGQKVQEAAICHDGGNGSHAFIINNTLAVGTYSVTIRETASGTIVNQSNLSVN